MVCASVAGVSAMNLKEAFTALSNLPYVKMDMNVAPSAIVIDGKTDSIGPIKVASAADLDAQQVLETGNAVYTILNQVPMKYMINGANNNLAGAFLYATPIDGGGYDFLVVTMSGYAGAVSFIHYEIGAATKDAFQNAKLELQGANLTITPENAGENSAYVIRINGPQ